MYLDTSFLSNAAKADAGELGTGLDAQKWRRLLECLREGVQRDILVCPASEIQIQESLLAPHLCYQFTRIQIELSGGYYFRAFEDILIHQTATELLKYLGRPEDINSAWFPFVRLPPGIVPPEETLRVKQNMLRFAENLRKQEIPCRTFAEQYEAERISFLQETFLQPLRQILGIDTYHKSSDAIKDLLHTGLFAKLLREAKISAQEFLTRESSKVLHFFESDLVDRVPYIHILCSINASSMVHERERRPKKGDLFDIEAVACALPYCTIVTTDKNMKKHIVDRLCFDNKYRAGVFSVRREDLDALVSTLSNILKQ